MSRAAVIDGLAFARTAAVLEGKLGMESLPRLAQAVLSSPGFHFVLTGENNARNRLCLNLRVEGKVGIVCQRCLGGMEWPMQVQVELELAASEAEVAMAEDDVDRIVAGPEMSIAGLVEDEILLALPMVPRHAQCSPAADWQGSKGPSAFQALASLKKSGR
jgi:uncharacterized protein